jgi:hypothetical protein
MLGNFIASGLAWFYALRSRGSSLDAKYYARDAQGSADRIKEVPDVIPFLTKPHLQVVGDVWYDEKPNVEPESFSEV